MATPRVNRTTGQDVTPDVTAPDGTTASAAAPAAVGEVSPASVAPIEAPAPVDNAEAREAALTALLNGTDAEVAKVEIPLDYNPEQKPVDFGGRTTCVVLFSRWNALVDGLFRSARKGTLINVSAKEADRGEALKGLRRIED